MRTLAVFPNVRTKLSGPDRFARAASAELMRPAVRETPEMFAPGRCMYASDFPFEKLWCAYVGLFDALRQCLDGLTYAVQRAVLHGTASRVYRT